MSKVDILKRITRAREEITVAEGELDDALRVLQVSSGGEKVSVSEVLGDAFDKLKDTKASLVKLEELLKAEV